jgi:formate hydrogenlyase transcriptional activator
MSHPHPESEPRRLPQDEALLEALEALTRHDDLTQLFHELAERLRKVVDFDFISVMLYDPASDVMRLHILESDKPMNIGSGPALSPAQSPGGWVWRSQEPMVIPDYDQETRFPGITSTWRAFGMRSGYYLPLTTPQRRLGAINFASASARSSDSCDLKLFARVARLVAVAVDNALNFQTAQTVQRQLASERDRLKLLLEVNNAVVSQLDIRGLMAQIAASLRPVLQQDYLSVALADPVRQTFCLYGLDFPASKGLVQEEMVVPWVSGIPASRALAAGRPMVFERADLEKLDAPISRMLLAEGIRCHCAVPLVSRSRSLGTLNVGRLAENSFTPTDVELLDQVARQIALAVENALAYRKIEELKNKLTEEKLYLEDEIRSEYQFAEIIGTSPAIKNILGQVRIVAPADTTVLIQGETGTGKELIARAIHTLSSRKERTFVKLNCAAIPGSLLESELFGHEKGAFTGAVAQKVGRFELADGGTLFLDEIGEIPLELQPKLLRVLQEQEFERIGGTRTLRVDVRLVAATNRDLAKMMAAEQFRSDLYYRLKVFPLTLPPLRERPEDIPLLVRYFVQQHARRLKRTIDSIPAEAMTALTRYPWPGNVRELENFIERSVLLSPDSVLRVAVEELKAPAELLSAAPVTLADAEREHILSALREANWVLGGPNGAAVRLGMKRSTLHWKMKKLNISRPG